MRGAAPLCTPLSGGSSAPPTPGDFLVRRKSPKTHQEPPGSWTSSTRGRTPLDSLTLCPRGIGCGSIEPAASSGASHLPSHGLKTESVPSMKPEEKTRPICLPAQSGKSVFFVVESSPGASVSAAPKRAFFRTGGIPKGGSPWRAFGDFPRVGKVTRVQGGAPALGSRHQV